MAYTQITSTPLFSAAFARVTGIVSALAERHRQYRLYRDTVDGLSALDNRELADLGIGRSDIRRVAMESTYR